MITIEKIKDVAREIIADDGWVNDSHTESEHYGVIVGLYELIEKLGGTTDDMPRSFFDSYNEWR